jgi:membrane-associated phospholipid phosphatase
MSFPSGHTCLAFATAATLAIMIPRWRPAFYALASVVAVERVVENAHYVTDVLAGAAVGTIAAHLTYWLCSRVIPPKPLVADVASPAEKEEWSGRDAALIRS